MQIRNDELIRKKIYEHFKKFNNTYAVEQKDYTTYTSTKKPTTPTTYRTVDAIIEVSFERFQRQSFIQFKDENTWRFIPNETYIQEHPPINIHELPSELNQVNSNIWAEIKSRLPRLETTKSNIVFKSPISKKIPVNYQSYDFGPSIPTFPKHQIFENKYPHINDYLASKTN